MYSLASRKRQIGVELLDRAQLAESAIQLREADVAAAAKQIKVDNLDPADEYLNVDFGGDEDEEIEASAVSTGIEDAMDVSEDAAARGDPRAAPSDLPSAEPSADVRREEGWYAIPAEGDSPSLVSLSKFCSRLLRHDKRVTRSSDTSVDGALIVSMIDLKFHIADMATLCRGAGISTGD